MIPKKIMTKDFQSLGNKKKFNLTYGQHPIFLETTAFNKARNYLFTHGRPLERAQFSRIFEGGSEELVLKALLSYQNDDGGFGHGLEPDLRTSHSSALCTSVALQILKEHKTKCLMTTISRALSFLKDSFDEENSTWRIIPLSAQKHPHAPWWNQSEPEEVFSIFRMNPTAELLGYFIEFAESTYTQFTTSLAEVVEMKLNEVVEPSMHDLLCLLHLFQTEGLSESLKDSLFRFLSIQVLKCVELDPSQWKNYCLQPLQIAKSPDSLFFPDLEEYVEVNLNAEISSQNEDGSWTPSWTWGEQDPVSWKETKREWSGVLTLEKLKVLKQYDRLISN